jgi:molybdopterin converting factor small subunit
VSTVTVQLFASYADLLGASTVELPFAPGATVRDLIQDIRALPGASALPSAPRVAVYRTFAPLNTVLASSDEIALIPPVAGG